MIEVWAVGGYSEIGRNMTGINIDGEVVILDMGLHMDKIVAYSGDDVHLLPYDKMLEMDMIADDREFRKEWGQKVKAIICGHAHLDHVGAIPVMAKNYNVPIIVTPFTAEVIKGLFEKRRLRNKLIPMNAGQTRKISDNIELEFVHITHSTLQTVVVVLKTKYGNIVYANDYKLDNHPVIGKKPNYKRLKELGKEGVVLFICDTTRIELEGHTYSEQVVKAMLEDLFEFQDTEGKAVFVTTFASHIARISTLVSIAKKLGRTPVILGRSMASYVGAAERLGLYRPKCEVLGYKKQIAKKLREINRNREKYFVILTGNQGEPDAVLSRVANDKFDFRFNPGDIVIFSTSTIPTATCQANRETLESKLKEKKVRVFKDVHVSGHASREDLRDMLEMLKPKHFIPTHGGIEKITKAAELAVEEGYIIGRTVHILQNGSRLILNV